MCEQTHQVSSTRSWTTLLMSSTRSLNNSANVLNQVAEQLSRCPQPACSLNFYTFFECFLMIMLFHWMYWLHCCVCLCRIQQLVLIVKCVLMDNHYRSSVDEPCQGVCMYMCIMCTCMYMYIVCACMYMCIMCTCMYMYIVCACTYVHVYYVYIHVHIHCVCTCTYLCIVCTRMYMCIVCTLCSVNIHWFFHCKWWFCDCMWICTVNLEILGVI